MEERIDNIITLSNSDGDKRVEVIEETVIKGVNYLLVATIKNENSGEEDECLILKDTSGEDTDEASYEIVDGEERDIAFNVFEKILGDDDIQLIK